MFSAIKNLLSVLWYIENHGFYNVNINILSFEQFWRIGDLAHLDHRVREFSIRERFCLLSDALWDSPWIAFGRFRTQFWSPRVTEERFGMTIKIIDFTLSRRPSRA